MKTISTQEELSTLMADLKNVDCILRIFDNKSEVILQTVVVRHPVLFIRGIQDFAKNFSIPVSDISVRLIGYIEKEDNNLITACDVFEISPYVYFKKPEEQEVSEEK